MLFDLLRLAANSLFIVCFEQFLHLLSHNPRYGGPLYRWHKLHHIDYPLHKLQSDKYINSGEGHIIENRFLYCILITQFCIYNLTSYRTFLIFFVQSMSYSIFVNYIHIQYHLKNSYLNKYELFRKHRDYHLLHHKKMRYNMGFITNKMDKLNGTFLETDD